MGIDETIEGLKEMQRFYQMHEEKELKTIESAIAYIRWVKKTKQRIHDMVTNLKIIKNSCEDTNDEIRREDY